MLAVFKKSAGMALVALALAACGGPGSEEFQKMSDKLKLGKPERAAMTTCFQQMTGTQPIIRIGSEEKMLADVPLEMCGCQSRTMVKYFNPDGFDGHLRTVKYLAKPEKKGYPSMSRKQLKKGVLGALASEKLAKSFEACAASFVAEYGKTEEFKDLLLPPPEKPKPREEKKQASAE
jgi:hypothetical protein